MERKFKAGDTVRIKDGLVIGKEYGGITFLQEMNFKSIRVIKEVIQYTGSLLIDVSNDVKYVYSPEMLELVEDNGEKPKFKVGDKVLIKKGLIHDKRYETILYIDSMYKDYTCTIDKAIYLKDTWVYTIKEDPYKLYYTAPMFVLPGEVKSYMMKTDDIHSRIFEGLLTSIKYIQTDVDNTSLQLHLKKRRHIQFNFNL